MFKKILIISNTLVSLGIIMIHYSAQINPLDFWPFAFLGLAYPIVLCLCVLFSLVWLFSSTKYLSFISLIALAITWKSNIASFQVSTHAQTLNEVSIMTWNVKNFDYYNWSGGEDTKEKMFALIEDNRPDILCLQEFYTEDKGEHKNLKALKKRMDYKYYYFAKTYSLDNNRHWGLLIFSDYKILDTGKLTFVEGTRLNSCMYADIQLSETQNTRVYNVHLQSNQFSQEDYNFFGNMGENPEPSSGLKIIQKLKKGYINRAKQTTQVKESKASSPYPSIICGDFNDTPVSFAYKALSENMQDAFKEKGLGFGKTFVNPSPFLRIDYGLFHPLFTINDYRTISEDLSDHYPVLIRFTY